MVEQILAALFVIGLLLLTVWVLRRKGLAVTNVSWRRSAGPKAIQVVERVQLTAQHSLHLVQYGDELILIGASPSNCARVAVFRQATHRRDLDAGL